MDNPAEIKKCLSCKKKKCTNCLQYVKTYRNIPDKYNRDYITEFLQSNRKLKDAAAELGVSVRTIQDFIGLWRSGA